MDEPKQISSESGDPMPVTSIITSKVEESAIAANVKESQTLQLGLSKTSSTNASTHDEHIQDPEKGATILESQPETSEPVDPNIVDFDGPDDPLLAVNWPASKKWRTVALLSALTFITYVCHCFKI
jgi:hypothetical protein